MGVARGPRDGEGGGVAADDEEEHGHHRHRLRDREAQGRQAGGGEELDEVAGTSQHLQGVAGHERRLGREAGRHVGERTHGRGAPARRVGRRRRTLGVVRGIGAPPAGDGRPPGGRERSGARRGARGRPDVRAVRAAGRRPGG
ncbi:hypothetical protein [Georgenia sp. SUBG003]|uniref:hypothetical protein n=1 Tax=Georgenia sp. SUBG003 TaxID=1497974 RepID=UPI003AB30A8E